MAHLTDVPDIMGTLYTLKDQVQDAKGKLVSAREESVALRNDQADLLERLAKKDQTISWLKCRLTDEVSNPRGGRAFQVFAILATSFVEDNSWSETDYYQVQAQRKEVWRLAKMYKSGRDPTIQLQKIDRLKKQCAGGFVKSEKPGTAPEFAPVKEAQRTGKGTTLRDMALSFSPSTVRPQIIRDYEWKLSSIEPMDPKRRKGTDQDETAERQAMDEDEISPHIASFPGARHDSLPVVGTTIPGHLAPLKRRRSDFPAASQYLLSGDPRRDSLEDSISGRFASAKRTRQEQPDTHRMIRRKPVCVSCWKESGLCDFGAQCKRCHFQGITCVRKLCSDDRCASERCPCLHVGQWDETDELWVVEAGQLPPKDRDMVRRTEADYYRPTHSPEKVHDRRKSKEETE